MVRVLFADDQVPDAKLVSDDQIRSHYAKLYPNPPDFADGFVFMRHMVKRLQDEAYEVAAAATPNEVRRLIRDRAYDVVVLDLCWYAAGSRHDATATDLGWQLAQQVKSAAPSAQIIMFSHQFYENQELAATAAEKGCLPVYKTYDDACARNLLVTVKWAANRVSAQTGRIEELKDFDLGEYKLLSRLLLVSIAAAIALLLVSVLFVVVNLTAATVFRDSRDDRRRTPGEVHTDV
jgi:CheY-like chemotaxis protein